MRNYVNRLHLVGIATLALLTLGLALFGWSLRPASGGFLAAPSDLAFYVTTSPGGLSFTETMTPAGAGGAVLEITATGIPDVPQEGPWTLVVDNIGSGRLCTPSSDTNKTSNVGGESVRNVPQHVIRTPPKVGYLTNGRHRPIGLAGRGEFLVRICWPSGGPVALNGAYLSARFPLVVVEDLRDAYAVAHQLDSAPLDTADYAVQSLQQPTKVAPLDWYWAPNSHVGLLDTLIFTAVDTSATQHDSYQAFLSGIVFGVAGGALVALVQELVAPFRTRKELRPPEPGG